MIAGTIKKLLSPLTLVGLIAAGAILGAIGMIKFWYYWSFKDVNLYKHLHNDG